MQGLDEDAVASWGVDMAVALLLVAFLADVTLNFRSHRTGFRFAEEGFFTPAHTFLYATVLGIAALIGGVTYHNRRPGEKLTDAIPAGYELGGGRHPPVRALRRMGRRHP